MIQSQSTEEGGERPGGHKRNTKHRKVFLMPPSKTQTHKKVCQFHLNLLDVVGLPAEVINIGLTGISSTPYQFGKGKKRF